MRFGAAALVAPQPGETCGCAQLPELGLLLRGNALGFAVEFLGSRQMPLLQQQLALPRSRPHPFTLPGLPAVCEHERDPG
jgi:hypothetical protein